MTATRQGSAFPPARSIIRVPQSDVIAGIEWLGEEIPYPEAGKKGDTFPISWAADGHQYTSAGDPCWGDKGDGLDFECISGDAPDYHIEKVNDMPAYRGAGGAGPKPTGLISVGGALYMAVQNVTGSGEWEDSIAVYGHGYDGQIICSYDDGKSWTPDIKALDAPMFPGRSYAAAAFVNYGRDNAGATDEFVYAISGEGWDNGCACLLARVPADRIMDRSAWTWVGSFDEEGAPQWTGDMTAAVPVISHPGYLGYVEMVYIAPLKRYLLLSWHHKVKCNPDAGSELIIYDAPAPWGPFTLAHFEDPWESMELNPYNPRLPLKWFDPARLEGWLLFSGSWRNGGGTPYYRAHIRRFRLLLL